LLLLPLAEEQAKLYHSSNAGMGLKTTKVGCTKKKTYLYEVGLSLASWPREA